MEIDAVTTAAPTVAAAASKRANISSDFDTFLKMLTVQLQNQDPLNPVESTDYAVQLATFSGVEQQVQTNTLLQDLLSQFGASGIGQMASWVGMEARVPAPGAFNGAPIGVLPVIADGATDAELVVRNTTGALVQRVPVAIDGKPVSWAGVDDAGNPFPAGSYSFSTVSYAGEEVLSEAPAETYSRVTEVQLVKGEAILILQDGTTVPAASVSGLREPRS